jgi:ABC-type proline/glycine betaine transport system permease subunit
MIPLEFPRIPVGSGIQSFFDLLTTNLSAFFDGFSNGLGAAVDALVWVLEAPPAVVLAVILTLIGLVIRGWTFAVGTLIGLLLIISMQQWESAMQTLALVVVSTVVALVIAIPLGIWAARKRAASAVLRPIMDLMQTMPAFVWLVPVVTLFGIGVVPGVVATIIFALPPGVRLTELGIRNVDHEIVEAANAFGATPRQTLFGVQLPLALPTIMAGVNQVLMLALSMAVVAGLVGGGGLGGQVTSAIATLDLGLGFEAGISVVILAIFLDRVTAAIGQGNAKHGLLRFLPRKQRQAAAAADEVEPSPEDEVGAESPEVLDSLPRIHS